MPDVFNGDGLTTKTLTEIRTELETAYKEIYGEDINLDPNSPDGQTLNLYAEGAIDLREILELINAGFDPDQAEGRVLDQRVALNGIARIGGTFTTVPVIITVDRALNLVGLDGESDELNPDIENLFTVKDDAGNLFYLLDSQTIVGAGSVAYSFRAAELGDVQVLVNTITTPVTIIAGVTDINNTSGASTQGVNEESDADLRKRRKISTSISAIGYLDAIESALQNLDNVVTAIVLENDTDTIDSNTIPPHSIWAIVEGGDDTEIGEVIYAKKSSGSGMKGSETVNITRPNGTTYTAKFDRPSDQNLWIKFSLSLPGGGAIDNNYIKDQIVENVVWGVGADAVGSQVSSFVQSLNEDYQITGMLVSDDDITYLEIVAATLPVNRFVNSTTRITIT
jgi:hypothetical protein